MYTATAGVALPTTIIGSLPRPGWYTENLGRRAFREAMVERSYREQYLDAVSVYLRDQETAGLDIVTDGDCRFDAEDRKSTRLNSSHGYISYAVFCLKKKKKTNTKTQQHSTITSTTLTIQ